MVRRRSWLGAAVALTMLPGLGQAQDGLVIFAAASLKNALEEIAADWTRTTGKPAPKISYAASSALARQIEADAPADLFISADLDWMDYVEKKDLIRKDTRFDLLGNKIVVIAPKDSRTMLDLVPGVDVAKALAGGRLAMGNVDAVPAGKYGKAALEKLGAGDYDLVLTDLKMPDMDGLQTTQRVRQSADPRLASLVVIGLTASNHPQDRQACLDAGMNDVLVKPLHRDALRECVGVWCATARGAHA